jgi:CRISPR/Cas system-associated exonuclease Cas4 (RecB family)
VRASLATTRLWPRDILGVERFFRATTPEGLRIAGAVDLVLRAGPDTVEIRDHKVTRFVRRPDDLGDDRQLNLYGWLVRATWPWARRVVASHHYPLLREVVTVELDGRRVDETLQQVRRVGAAAEADDRFTPTPGGHCGTCAYRGMCDAAAIAA